MQRGKPEDERTGKVERVMAGWAGEREDLEYVIIKN
jgi:hypothetical protein